MESKISKRTLTNGLRLLIANQTQQNVAAIKVFIRVGSQNDGDVYGMTHFLEHALFNHKEANRQLFYNVERHGGVVNANTTKEYMSIYFIIAVEYSLNVLSQVLDIIFQFSIADNEVETEKLIIAQEILSHQNSPGAMWDLFMMNYWNTNPLRNPIRGFTGHVDRIKRGLLEQHYNDYISPDRMVISCAGPFQEEEMVVFLESYFLNRRIIGKHPSNKIHGENIESGKVRVERDLLLNHLFIAFPTKGYVSPNRLHFKALSKLLGEGAYSRLYQLLREDKKLVYSIEANEISYADTGLFLIYTKCKSELESCVEEHILRELERIKTELISEHELEFIQGNYSGKLKRSFETSLSVCSSFGIEEILTGSYVSFQQSIDRFNGITREDIMFTASQVFDSPRIVIIGK